MGKKVIVHIAGEEFILVENKRAKDLLDSTAAMTLKVTRCRFAVKDSDIFTIYVKPEKIDYIEVK